MAIGCVVFLSVEREGHGTWDMGLARERYLAIGRVSCALVGLLLRCYVVWFDSHVKPVVSYSPNHSKLFARL